MKQQVQMKAASYEGSSEQSLARLGHGLELVRGSFPSSFWGSMPRGPASAVSTLPSFDLRGAPLPFAPQPHSLLYRITTPSSSLSARYIHLSFVYIGVLNAHQRTRNQVPGPNGMHAM